MMRNLLRILLLFIILLTEQGFAKPDTAYLPENVRYNPNIPTPEQVIGYPIGDWHIRHDQLVNYMRALAASSDRVDLIEMGRSHEQRPLLMLRVTAAKHLDELEQLRQQHLNNVEQGRRATNSEPLILWMGYGVHGNEPSGSNAALLVAYYLAAAQGEKVNQLLENAIVLLDPSLNPDGLSRFAQWANMHRGKVLNPDSQHREHREAWPSGRTNHYWFDLNRDWLPLVHPESQARIKQFHQWRPHVLTDFHEMGTNSTYFFQPGIPSRKNPWTPDKNVELTKALAKFHAKALDDSNQLYYTEESFDDFYYGKGSTYPDSMGSVGILFEQASSRGHLLESVNGLLSFEQSIQNQVTTSLSTFEGALANKAAFHAYQKDFKQQTEKLAKKDKISGYVVSAGADSSKFASFVDVVRQHHIKYQYLDKNFSFNSQRFLANQSIYIPLDQDKYRLIKSLFSTRQSFNDNSFYDVSNWNLALAYNLPYAALKKGYASKLSLTNTQAEARLLPVKPEAYAYGFSWEDSQAPHMLQQLLNAGVKVKLAGAAFSANTEHGKINFEPGAILIPSALKQPQKLLALLSQTQEASGVQIWSITSGLTAMGIDLGSERMLSLKDPKVLVVGGAGTSQYEAGEVWHYLDQGLGLAASIVDLDRLDRIRMGKYSHMIWVQGRYSTVSDEVKTKIHNWVKAGGVLIGQKSASKWFSDNKWLKAKFVKHSEIKDGFDASNLSFADRQAFRAKTQIAGAVFNSTVDLTHPLAFGLTNTSQPLFRNHEYIMKKPTAPFVTPAIYTESPLMAGFTAKVLQELVADSAAIVAHRVGRGRIIAFADNTLFRGYWKGSSRLLANAIYMSGFINVAG